MMVSVDLSVFLAICRKLVRAFSVRWSTISLSRGVLIVFPPVVVLVRSFVGIVGIGLPRCLFLLL